MDGKTFLALACMASAMMLYEIVRSAKVADTLTRLIIESSNGEWEPFWAKKHDEEMMVVSKDDDCGCN